RSPAWRRDGSVQQQPAVRPRRSSGEGSRVCETCRGAESKPRLSYNTSVAIENPPRIEVVPLFPGDHANPMRGRKFFFCDSGALKEISPGTLEIALSGCHRRCESGT